MEVGQNLKLSMMIMNQELNWDLNCHLNMMMMMKRKKRRTLVVKKQKKQRIQVLIEKKMQLSSKQDGV